jgi:hypothetical protein
MTAECLWVGISVVLFAHHRGYKNRRKLCRPVGANHAPPGGDLRSHRDAMFDRCADHRGGLLRRRMRIAATGTACVEIDSWRGYLQRPGLSQSAHDEYLDRGRTGT